MSGVRTGVSIGPLGIRFSRRACTMTVVIGALLLVASAVSVFTGTLEIPGDRVLAALQGNGTAVERLVIVDHRLSRALVAILVGFTLGLSGALTQSITRNPIASPDILGVSAGASVFAVLVLTRPDVTAQIVGGGATVLIAPAALAGGLLTTALILGLSWRGGFDGLRLILVGIGVNALAASLVAWLLLEADLESAAVATRWLSGSIDGARMSDVWLVLPVAVACALACFRLSMSLGSLRLGHDVASSLGTSTTRTELGCLLVAVVAVSAATVVAGPIGFVAFVGPQAAMRLFGTAGPPPIAGGLAGAALMLLADLLAQRLPVGLPVGVVTAVLGAPALLYLLIRYVKRASV